MPGSQEGFCKLLDLFMNEGEPIMVQVPTYTATLGAVGGINIKNFESSTSLHP